VKPIPDETDPDDQVLEIARAYLAELEAGRKPDRQAYLRRHPERAAQLRECLDGIDMAHAVGSSIAPPPEPECRLETLGDFQIIREVGRGGMGIVYEAVQLSLGRRVALKVLPFAASLDAKHLQRFKTEAHAAAGLHHTNIVPVYAVGCDRGVHFYAMQLIDGRPLDAVISELRGASLAAVTTENFARRATSARPPEAGRTWSLRALVNAKSAVTVGSAPTRVSQRSGRARESFRMVARLAAQVADALEYAHQAGVVHRDIKPANLLLDGRGTIWVTDFGLAQVTADVSLTQTGDVLGTLRYMSPEQATGKSFLLDHRTDIYSLGATLYELLTLQPIFDGTDRRALLNQILMDDPTPLRAIDRSIPRELETIVLKAVAKAPEDRYSSAAEMAADLRRFLDEQPILAKRPSLIERMRKWMKRHPSIVGAAVLLLVFAVVALGTTTALVAREQAQTANERARAVLAQEQAEREQKRAVREQERAEARAKEAEERFQLALTAADDIIQVADEELADQPQMESVRKRLLEAALVHYRRLIEYRRDDPATRAQLSATRDRVQQIVDDLAVLQGRGQIDLLVYNESVRDDLDLSAEQHESVLRLADKMVKERWEAFDAFIKDSGSQRRKRFLQTARENDSTVKATLTARQRTRLKQIALQNRGLAAFQEPQVINALKLTIDQRDSIRGIEGKLFFSAWRHHDRHKGSGRPPGGEKKPEKKESPRTGFVRPGGSHEKKGDKPAPSHPGEHARSHEKKGDKPGQPGFRWPWRPSDEAVEKAFVEALAVLTPEQKSKWQKMIGPVLKGATNLQTQPGFGHRP
jgi:serine/threonine protein kinase